MNLGNRLTQPARHREKLGLGLLTAVFSVVLMPSHVLPQTSTSSAAGGKAQVWKTAEMDIQSATLVDQAKSTGLAEAILGNYDNHAVKLLVRTANGQAEVHANSSDVIIVVKGRILLITGGTVIDPKTEQNGEIRGSGIKGGLKRDLSVGDVVHIPPDTPHQMLLPHGTVFNAVLIKVQNSPPKQH